MRLVAVLAIEPPTRLPACSFVSSNALMLHEAIGFLRDEFNRLIATVASLQKKLRSFKKTSFFPMETCRSIASAPCFLSGVLERRERCNESLPMGLDTKDVNGIRR